MERIDMKYKAEWIDIWKGPAIAFAVSATVWRNAAWQTHEQVNAERKRVKRRRGRTCYDDLVGNETI